jgi:hypothetical protein
MTWIFDAEICHENHGNHDLVMFPVSNLWGKYEELDSVQKVQNTNLKWIKIDLGCPHDLGNLHTRYRISHKTYR